LCTTYTYFRVDARERIGSVQGLWDEEIGLQVSAGARKGRKTRRNKENVDDTVCV
jgi:hypothetical protein